MSGDGRNLADPARLHGHALAALESVRVVQLVDKRPQSAQELNTSIGEAARFAAAHLERITSALAATAPPLPIAPQQAIPFHLLDTPDTRELLVGLGKLLPIAERVDYARGRSLAEPVGGSAGTDLAEDIAQLIARLELEIYGPSKRVTGGRE